MKVAMVIFSPGGNTLKAGNMLREELERRGGLVQIVDLTRSRPVFNAGEMRSFLEANIPDHDVLCIGGPVYAHHLHYNVKNIIKALPKPGDKWGKLAAPFVTYGVISSGIALHEAGVLLRRSGRTPALGMKLEAFHCMSRLLSTKVGQGLPGPESLPVIAEFADRISRLGEDNPKQGREALPSFNYQSFGSKLKAKLIFREKFWHRRMYPKLGLDRSLCRQCGKCAAVCPVQRLEKTDTNLIFQEKPECIHCGECIHVCPFGAMSFLGDLGKFNKVFAEAAKGKGPLPSHENPKSAVYPIHTVVN